MTGLAPISASPFKQAEQTYLVASRYKTGSEPTSGAITATQTSENTPAGPEVLVATPTTVLGMAATGYAVTEPPRERVGQLPSTGCAVTVATGGGFPGWPVSE